jgi:hypothetical protein
MCVGRWHAKVFAPLITAAAVEAQRSGGLNYTVLLILTDGVVNDMQQVLGSLSVVDESMFDALNKITDDRCDCQCEFVATQQ